MGQKINFSTGSEEGKEMEHGKFFAMIQRDGSVFRFVIRDRAGLRPSIHGFGRSMNEAESKIDEILGALDNLAAQAA